MPQIICRQHRHEIKNLRFKESGRFPPSKQPPPSTVCTRCYESRWWLHKRRTEFVITSVARGVLPGWFLVSLNIVKSVAAVGSSSPIASSPCSPRIPPGTMLWCSVMHLNTVKDLLVTATKEFPAAASRLGTVFRQAMPALQTNNLQCMFCELLYSSCLLAVDCCSPFHHHSHVLSLFIRIVL